MPAMLPAAAASTAIGTGAAIGTGIGAGTALGTGLAAGSALASGAGIFSNFMAGAAPGLAGTLGGVSAPVAASIAPAATSQLMGTIGGSVAPGAFGANLAGATSGLTSALPGVTSTLPGVTSTLPGVYNPATAETLAAKFLANSPYPVANASNLNFLNSATAGLQGSGGPLQMYSGMNSPAFLNTTLQGSALPGVTSNLPAASLGNAVTGPAIPNVTSQLATAPATSQIIPPTSSIQTGQNFLQNLGNFFQNPSMQGVKDYVEEHPYASAGIAGLGAMGVKKLFEQKGVEEPENNAMIRPYTYERTQRPEAYAVSPTQDSSERLYFNDQFVAGEPYKATEKAEGGIVSLAVGGPVEQMAAMNAVGSNTGYPMASLQAPMYANPAVQRPEATNVIAPSADAGVGLYSGEPRFASGGISHLGDYSDGGRLLKGPGDGVSDSIPASIGGRQPARLADGEFVVPARIVSELGNGSTEAGARKLYAMMDRIQKARKKSVGSGKVAVNSKADKYLPA